MILSRRVALNGAELDQVDPAILIQGIDEGTGKDTISAVNVGSRDGQRITRKGRDTVDITVRFSICIGTADLEGRASVLDAVGEWAARAADGALLTVNYRPQRQIRVTLAQCPGAGDIRARTTQYAIVFRAYEVPYWENVEATVASIKQGTSGTCYLTVPGSAETAVKATLINRSGSVINAVTIFAGQDSMTFASLGLAAGETLEIDHTDKGLLMIRIRSTGGVYRSAMDKRTMASSDDLRVRPGTTTAGFTATGACTLSVAYKGRYL